MTITDLIPWRRQKSLPIRHEDASPFLPIQQEFNRLFDELQDTWGDFLPVRPGAFGAFVPHVSVKERDADYQVSAELPGLDQKDVKIELQGNTLVVEGEKHEEHEDKKGGYVWSERRYGSFRRDIPLPEEVDRAKIEASFHKGVLTVVLPKTPAAKKMRKRIEVKAK